MAPGIHGILLIITGILHSIFTLFPFIYGHQWRTFIQSGLWKSVHLGKDREMAAFWFGIAGSLMNALGLCVYELEMAGLHLPASIGLAMLSISLLGALMSPKSGFTFLLVPQSIFYLVTSMFGSG